MAKAKLTVSRELEEKEAHEAAAITLRKIAAVADLMVAAGEALRHQNPPIADGTVGDIGWLLRDLAYAAVERSAAAGAV